MLLQFLKSGRKCKGRLLFFSCLLGGIPVQAQSPKIYTGLEAVVAGKIPILAAGGTPFGIWGNTGLSLVNIIEGEEEGALSLRSRLSVSFDITRYAVQGYGAFIVDRGSLIFNPEIMFPTRSGRLNWLVGIGVEWNGYFLAQPEREGVVYDQELIATSRRKLFPFLSGGLQYDLNRDFSLQLFLRQMLLDAFRKHTALSFRGNPDEPDLKLNQQATYFGFGLTYFFNSKEK